jgi:hypothetical protein
MSMRHVVSNIAPTVVAFLGTLPRFDERVNAVYEDGLDYDAALKKFRAENKSKPEGLTYPLLIFRRGALQHSEHGVGRRLVNHTITNLNAEGGFDTFKAIYAELDIDFLLVTPSAADLENFEISYLSETGQQQEKKFSYQAASLGSFEYFVQYDTLQEKVFQVEQKYWKGLAGSATIRGFFFVATGTAARITEIQANFKDLLNNENFKSITISP